MLLLLASPSVRSLFEKYHYQHKKQFAKEASTPFQINLINLKEETQKLNASQEFVIFSFKNLDHAKNKK